MPTIFHIDVNSAYLSWTAIEKLRENPSLDLRTIPSIIGGDEKSRHGIVLAKSIPAKKFGIRTAEPVASAFRKCPTLHMEPPDHKLYKKKSRELMSLLHTYTSDIEQVSIDECYLDFTPIAHRFSSPLSAAREIADRIRNELGFTVNIGIAPNKLLAKMASDFEKPDRIHTLFPEEIPTKMWPLPVGELFMVGHASAERLARLGIHTIGELAHADPAFLQLHFKSHGISMWEHANGIDHSFVDSEEHDLKGIGNSTTLSEDITRTEDARKVLRKLAEQVSQRLRKARQIAGTVTVEIKYNTFQSCSRQTQLLSPVNTADELFQCACQLFDELWNGTPVRLLGLRTTKLVSDDTPVQLSLFDFGFSALPEEKRTPASEIPAASGRKVLPASTQNPGRTFSPVRGEEPTSMPSSTRTQKTGVLSSGREQTADGGAKKSSTISKAAAQNRQNQNLFPDPSILNRQKRLDEAVSQIRQKFGKNAIMRGALLNPSSEPPKEPS